MAASRRVTRAVGAVLDLAPRHGEVSLTRLVDAVSKDRGRPIELKMAELPPGVCGQWRQYSDRDVFLIQEGLPAWDRTLAHELGHLVLGHEGTPVVEAARESVEVASFDLIGYMLNQRTGCMGPAGEDAEQEAEDFAALLLYRLGRLPSDRSSIVQVRLGEAFG
ncbi:ImmA/IrrE family metallo-endopeptidase [Mycolicibacterium pulveris]|uniref:ImmA/IrrE family metallo-endopeptidase n=1 Tax=Mycolicibacterium pulveris TaxID=36813 RepID=UPI003CE707F5